jgi:hypothetical protein
MMIELSLTAGGMEECQNCMKTTRDKIHELFMVISADNSPSIDSRDLIRAFTNIKKDDEFAKKYEINSKMINHFLLQGMEY